MPEWLKEIIERLKRQGLTPVADTWLADLFEWEESGKFPRTPRAIPGTDISPIEAVITHPGLIVQGLAKAFGERVMEELPGMVEYFNPVKYAERKRAAATIAEPTPQPTPPVVPFTGNLGTLPGPTPTPPVDFEVFPPSPASVSGQLGRHLMRGQAPARLAPDQLPFTRVQPAIPALPQLFRPPTPVTRRGPVPRRTQRTPRPSRLFRKGAR